MNNMVHQRLIIKYIIRNDLYIDHYKKNDRDFTVGLSNHVLKQHNPKETPKN